ncbi:dTDP-4-dehydrorhamnose reductase [Erwinia sp. ErVv1]|uniref:dTDP-4-dehydrorhamnose reductase n=1 Tax=Erwinia sp. ErVv1 TaxID=1603299 RepID=UPI0008295AB9|nr:dTDP-4-dehydrorhamnose reductase [Erwinia sp. ErVv1]
MRLLILGAAGQVGREITRQACPQWIVRAVDRSGLDITDSSAIDAIVSDFKPDIIINAAAYTAVDKAETEEIAAYAINCDGAKFLAQAAEKSGAALLHISTDYVFSGDKDGLYQENDATGPTGVYGASKLAGEKAIQQYCQRHIIMRTAWVFGEFGNNFVKTMIRLARDRETLDVVGDQYGSPTWAGDIANALLTISQRILEGSEIKWGIYHFSGFPYTNWYEFADKILTIASNSALINRKPLIRSITTFDYPTPARRPLNSKLNCSKILENFHIQPSDWQAALKKLHSYTD